MPVDIPGVVNLRHMLCLDIAGVKLKVNSAVAFRQFKDFGFYKDFIVPEASRADCRLDHRIGPAPEFISGRPAFCAGNWQLASDRDRHVLRVGPARKDGTSDNLTVFARDYRSGVLYQKSVFELFSRFIDQFLIMNLLSRNEGFLLHSSGVVWNGKGICFAGPSGSGKSTLLELFRKELRPEFLLNDDRLALRRHGARWRVFGTPWYGESRVSSSASADLRALFLIRHARRNYIHKPSVREIVPQLAVLGLMPVWDRSAASAVLVLFEDLIRAVPIYELGFVPDKRVISLIRKTIS